MLSSDSPESDHRKEIKELDAAIQAERDKHKEPDVPEKGVADAMRMAVELVACVGVGSFGGYHLDRWLDTLPIFFLIGFFLGVAAGFFSLYKQASKL